MHTKQDESEGRRRRRYTEEFKAEVVAKCRQPGVSMAGVALAHRLNANLLRRWVEERKEEVVGASRPVEEAAASVPRFLPFPAPAVTEAGPATIQIEITRGTTKIAIAWPTSALADSAAWLREVLG